jgi:hypothetical protein
MQGAPMKLHSERAGRVRQLPHREFARLIWHRIARARDYHWLFKGSLEPYRGLGPERDQPRIYDAEDFFLRRLRVREVGSAVLRNHDAPIFLRAPESQDVLLDLIEVLHAEIVAKPILVDPPQCTLIEGFDQQQGQVIFREEMNEVLTLANPPLELLPSGQIVEIDEAHRGLYREPLPADVEVEAEIADPVQHAVHVYLARGATPEDKRAAVRQLADALEHLRPEVKEELLSADERDLFLIANSFAIRHNRPDQRRNFDKGTWLDWIFHLYLATIRAVLAVRNSQAEQEAS